MSDLSFFLSQKVSLESFQLLLVVLYLEQKILLRAEIGLLPETQFLISSIESKRKNLRQSSPKYLGFNILAKYPITANKLVLDM